MVPTRPSYQACAEDEDFLAALDKMVNENIAESKNVGEFRYISQQLLKTKKFSFSSRQKRYVLDDWSCEWSQGEKELGAASAGD